MIQRGTARNLWCRYNTLVRYISKDISDETKQKKIRSIRIHKENKKLFGSLLETLPEKKRREEENQNYAATNNEPFVYKDDRSAEMHWVENNCTSRTVRIRFKNHKIPDRSSLSASNSKNITAPTPMSSENLYDDNQERGFGLESKVQRFHDVLKDSAHVQLQSKFHSGATPGEDNQLVIQKNITKNPFELSDKQSSDTSHLQLLPPVIVRNLTTFPLQNKNRIIAEQTDTESNIISLPLNNDTKKKFKNYPSVTKILSSTMSEKSIAALEKWKSGLISKLGEDGFKAYHERLLAQGSSFHATIKNFLTSSDIIREIEPEIEACWYSLQPVLEHVSGVEVLESHVVHSFLMYHGIIDCIALYKGKPYLIEWKKSDKQKPHISSTYEAPLQAAAYLGALNYDNNYKMKVPGALVVVAYTDGSPAHVHRMTSSECTKYWKYWLDRLQLYWQRIQEGTIPHQNIPSRSTA